MFEPFYTTRPYVNDSDSYNDIFVYYWHKLEVRRRELFPKLLPRKWEIDNP